MGLAGVKLDDAVARLLPILKSLDITSNKYFVAFWFEFDPHKMS